MLALMVVLLALRFSTPTDGAYIDPAKSSFLPDGVLVTLLQPMPNGLRDGDVVVAIDGRSLEDWTRTLSPFRGTSAVWQLSRTLQYTVRRDGQVQDVAVTLEPYPISSFFNRFRTYWIVAVTFLVIGAFVFVRNRIDPAVNALLVMSTMLITNPWDYGLQISDLVSGNVYWVFRASVDLTFFAGLAAFLNFVLLFPQPHPFKLRHRWLVRAAFVGPAVANELFSLVVRLTDPSVLDWVKVTELANAVAGASYMAMIVIAMVSSFRLAAADPLARQKARLVTLSLLILCIAGPLWLVPLAVFGHAIMPFDVVVLCLGFLPISIAVAILRNRLFDIELIVNRTLVYGTLTLSLLLIYFASVVVFQQIFRALTGQISDVAVVASTLATAALFTPLRQRVQTVIDRRFYRQKYDAAKTLARFSMTLRDEVDLDQLGNRLVSVVEETMRPSRISLWVSHPEAPLDSWTARRVQSSQPLATEAEGTLAEEPV
jgi:hypothetical protein